MTTSHREKEANGSSKEVPPKSTIETRNVVPFELELDTDSVSGTYINENGVRKLIFNSPVFDGKQFITIKKKEPIFSLGNLIASLIASYDHEQKAQRLVLDNTTFEILRDEKVNSVKEYDTYFFMITPDGNPKRLKDNPFNLVTIDGDEFAPASPEFREYILLPYHESGHFNDPRKTDNEGRGVLIAQCHAPKQAAYTKDPYLNNIFNRLCLSHDEHSWASGELLKLRKQAAKTPGVHVALWLCPEREKLSYVFVKPNELAQKTPRPIAFESRRKARTITLSPEELLIK